MSTTVGFATLDSRGRLVLGKYFADSVKHVEIILNDDLQSLTLRPAVTTGRPEAA